MVMEMATGTGHGYGNTNGNWSCKHKLKGDASELHAGYEEGRKRQREEEEASC